MRSMMNARFLVIAALLPACAADFGGGAGAALPSGNSVGIGRLAFSTRLGTPLNDHGFLVGASVESRGEANVGSRFSTGVSLGYGDGPPLIGKVVGWEVFGDFGTPLRGKLFPGGALYAGGTFALPIRLDSDRHIREINDSTSIAARRFEIVPFARARVHVEPDADEAVELVGGVSLRFRMFSDLL
jgi:hypothetical protein